MKPTITSQAIAKNTMQSTDKKGRFIKGHTSLRKGVFKVRKTLTCKVCRKIYNTYHKVSHTCSNICKGKRFGFWEGDKTTYRRLHQRVDARRGKPNHCEDCKKDKKCDWANVSGNYQNVMNYRRLCKSCHNKLDRARYEKLYG